MTKKYATLWVAFFIYAFCCATMQNNLMFLLMAWGMGLSVYLLIKLKLPSKSRIVLSVVLSLLVMISYFGIEVSPNALLSGMITVPFMMAGSLATFRVMEETNEIRLLGKGTKKSAVLSVMIAICVGMVLSGVNYLFMKGNSEVDFAIEARRLLVSLNPAILEEIAMRSCFMAFCLYETAERRITKFQTFTMWFMMCVPHTMAHGYGIVETVILCLLFGLPFAILQRKRDIASAMISHGMVDAIRFTIFGLGM